jgi:hypothetical protein
MTYQAWTAKAVELRVVEMADTAQSLPRGGQRGFSRAWPEYIGLYAADLRVRDRPSAGAILRMEEAWSWLDCFLGESELLYWWSATKVQRSARIADFAEKMGMKDRTLRDHISKLCQRIADNLNQKHVVWLNNRVDVSAEILAYEPTDSLPEQLERLQPT